MSGGSPEVLICPSCGVIRAARKSSCPHCKADYGAVPVSRPRATDAFWVCVECTFQCRACGFRVPLNHLDMDGGVRCARCGLDQAFQVDAWHAALNHAHAVTEVFNLDLRGGPQDHGWAEEAAHLGERSCGVTQAFGGANGFEIKSCPGYPLCPRCHASIQVTTNEAATTVACAACNFTATYELPPTARKMTHGALRGIMAAEHTAGRAAVGVQTTPGAIAVTCPSCSAPLPASADSKFLKCAYCGTTARIPDHIWSQLSGRVPETEPIWLLFTGQSQERAAFERSNRKHAEKLERREQGERAREGRLQAERQEEQERHRKENEERQRADQATHEAERRAAKRKAQDGRALKWVFGGMATLVLGGVVCAVVLTQHADATVPQSGARGVPDAGTRDAGARAAHLPDMVPVRSCTCTSRSGADQDEFVLQGPGARPSDWSFDWTHRSGFVETESTLGLGRASRAVLPPANDSDRLRMGIACEGSTVAIVLGNRASAWSANVAGALWTATLPAAFAAATEDSAQTSSSVSSAFDAACAAPIPVASGVLSLVLTGGKRVRLSLKNGHLM